MTLDTASKRRSALGLYVFDYAGGAATDLTTVLAAITALSAQVSAAGVIAIAPVAAITGTLTIIRGDDYTLTSGRTLPSWTSTDWTPYDLSTATLIQFRARRSLDATVFTKTMTAVSDTLVRLELTDTETAAFMVGNSAYSFDIQASLATGDIVTLVLGKMNVVSDVR